MAACGAEALLSGMDTAARHAKDLTHSSRETPTLTYLRRSGVQIGPHWQKPMKRTVGLAPPPSSRRAKPRAAAELAPRKASRRRRARAATCTFGHTTAFGMRVAALAACQVLARDESKHFYSFSSSVSPTRHALAACQVLARR